MWAPESHRPKELGLVQEEIVVAEEALAQRQAAPQSVPKGRLGDGHMPYLPAKREHCQSHHMEHEGCQEG